MANNAREFINSWTSDLSNIGKKWETYTILPYGKAYRSAFRGLESSLQNQKAADQAEKSSLLRSLGLLALSLAGGGLLTAAFGSVVLKELASKAAVSDRVLNTLLNNNMNRTYRAVEYVATNKTASFIAGKLWDEGESKATAYFSNNIKNAMAQNSGSYPSVRQFAEDPEDVKDALMMFIGECQTKLHDIAAHIRDSATMDDDKKIAEVKRLGTSPFFKPSSQSVDPGNLNEDIELSFYLKMVLDTDYLETDWKQHQLWDDYGRSMRKAGTYYAPSKKTSINELPSSPNYPKQTAGSPSWMNPQYQTIAYSKMGDKIAARLNHLYLKKHGIEFAPWWPFGTQPDAGTLRLAEDTINLLNSSNIKRLVSVAREDVRALSSPK